MISRMLGRWLAPVLGVAVVLLGFQILSGTLSSDRSDLPRMGEALDFTLVDQTGRSVSLSDYRGKVVLVNFMFTKCPDYCPTLTSVLANVQSELIEDGLSEKVHFLSVSVDPANDTPDLLRRFADAMYVDTKGWNFLTGADAAIEDVSGAYGVFFARLPSGSVEHNLLTTVIDRSGQMRVQYVGERFDPDELLTDIRTLVGSTFWLI